MSFTNKIVIVTGASSGIGAATAIAFAKEGANVVIVGRNEVKLQKVTDECRQTGKEHISIKADITKDEDAKRVINATIDKFGQIDVLVNNAGMMGFAHILSDNVMSVYDTVMNLNVRAQVQMTHLAGPHLIKTKGNVINISSIAAKMMFTDPLMCYAISKAAVDHFTRSVALELAPHGVRVNSISPGPVRTDILSNSGVEKTMDEINYKTPLGRISESEEISDLILYIASDKAKAITGSDFVTDNGILLRSCKAGLNIFTNCAALELAPHGVGTSISPGSVYTDIWDGMKADPAKFKTVKLKTALDRISQPDEDGELILFLAIDKAVAFTGSNYTTDITNIYNNRYILSN